MQDRDIRKLLHPYLENENRKFKDTIIVDEFELCSGLSRIDVAVINGVIHGYEIKSEEDTLKRLANQINYYNKSLEKISVITNRSHLKQIRERVPRWWGLLLINDTDKRKKVTEIRKAKNNPILESQSMLHILWKDELIFIINKYKLKVSRHINKRKMRESVAKELDITILSYEILSALKSRQNWRS